MMLSDDYFKKLCSEVSHILQFADKNALGNGERVTLDDVDFFLISNFYQDQYARLILDLGEVEQDFKPEIYEAMFAMQGVLDGSLDAVFDYDHIRSCLMFRIKLPINLNTTAEGLVSVIKSFVLQIREWRNTLLKNKLLLEELESSQHYPLA